MPIAKKNTRSRSRPAKRGPAQRHSFTRQTKYVYLPWSFSRHLKLSLRNFKTNPTHRSHKKRQFIILVDSTNVKEIAFSLERRPKTRRSNQISRLSYRWAAASLILVLLGVGGMVLSLTHMNKSVRLDLSPSAKASARGVVIPKEALKSKTMPKSMPLRIRMPAIGVDTNIVSVGLDQHGAIDMPSSVDIAAWYNGSPTPGELGPAIIAGHVDNYYQGDGAFFALRNTQVGDLIYVDRADGSTAIFKVADIKQVPQANFPTQEVFGNINYAGIRVITCGGAFNHQTYEYEDNIVVFAILQ